MNLVSLFFATVVVAETQFYPVREQERGYFGRYADLPLVFDYATPLKPLYDGGRFSQADFEAYQREAQAYGIDGFAYFPASRPSGGLAASRSPVRDFATVPILGLKEAKAEQEETNIRQALDHPGSLRIGGKTVLLSYWDSGMPSPDFVARRLKDLRAKFGDTFVYFQSIERIAFHRYRTTFREKGRLAPDQVAELKDHLRAFLRVADGLQADEGLQMTKVENDVRIFDADYYRTVLGIMRKVMDEPEFGGRKLLCCNVMNGHENAYTRGYTLSHDGTRTLRRMFDAALAAKADVINLFEWDEWNENTSFLPTLCNSYSTKRIVRHYMDTLRGRAPQPLEGDDTSVPNLIVTYRQAIAPGETFFVEVLNVPDGVWKGPLSLAVTLADEAGRTVCAFPPKTVDAAALADARFTLAVDKAMARARAVTVKLDWKSPDGRVGSVRRGLKPVSVAPAESWMVKAVKQPIRDLAAVTDAAVSLKDGRLDVRVASTEPIRYAMVAADGIVQYVKGKDGKESRFRETDEDAVFAISAVRRQSLSSSREKPWTMKVAGVKEAEWIKNPFESVITGALCDFRWISVFASPTYLRLPKAKLAGAKLSIDMAEHFRGEIPLDVAFEKGAYAIGGAEGIEWSVARFNRQTWFPPALGERSAEFSIRPDKPRRSTVYDVTVVTESGKTWRSGPVVDEPDAAARLPDLHWDFSPAAGDVLLPRSGERRFFGMAGAEHAPVTLFNRGPDAVGAMLRHEIKPGEDRGDTHPRRVREPDGSWSLAFDGVNDYAGFPHETVPQFGAYTLSFEVFPERDGQRELLGGAYGEGGGSLAFIARDEKGRLVLDFMGLRFEHTTLSTGLALPAGQWSTVVISNDTDRLTAVVNGAVASRFCCHPGRNSSAFAIGGVSGKPFFKGRIRHLAIRHRPFKEVRAPLVVSQTQLYPQADTSRSYLNRYVDFPLFLDGVRHPMPNADRIGPKQISRTDFDDQLQLALDYGIDGYAHFPSWSGAANVMSAAAASELAACRMLPIIGFWYKPENEAKAIPEALVNPRGYEIGGKQLFLSYWTAKYNPPEKLKAKLADLRKTYGDRFVLAADLPKVASSVYQQSFRLTGDLTAAQKKEYQGHVRDYLRACDGVYLGETHMMNRPEKGELAFFTDYYRAMLALTRQVLDEPEFAGRKIFGASAIVGHENAYARGHNTSQNGTRTLRESLAAAIAAKPDFIMLPEWDEWNENTCFAPTLYNSFSTKRIVRQYMAKLGKLQSPDLRDDDTTVPNLIVSYRRLLAPGEPVSIEVLNLPDDVCRGELSVTVSLVNEKGELLKSFPAQKCWQTRETEMRFEAASEDFAARARTLGVVVRCRDGAGRETAYGEGLLPIDLASGNGWLHKNVKQPLRDLAPMTEAKVSYADGRLRAALRCAQPIRYAMAVANGDVVKVIGTPGDEERFREDDEYAVFALSDVACRGKADAKAGYRFAVRDGGDVEWLRLPSGLAKGDIFKVDWISIWTESIFLRIRKSALKTAQLEIDFPGFAHKTVSLKTAFERGVVATGEGCATFGVSRFRGQARFPRPLNRADCAFDIPVAGNRRSNAFYVEVVTMDGKTWRSKAFVDEPADAGVVRERVWSAAEGGVREVMLPKARTPSLAYDFSDVGGDVILPSSGETRFLGVLGGAVGAVAGYNRGPSTDNALDGLGKWTEKVVDFRPRRENGAFVFDGVDDVVSFPSDTLPFASGWTVSFDFRPTNTERIETILACRTRFTGNLWGLSHKKGRIKFSYVAIGVSGKDKDSNGYTGVTFPQEVRYGEWNRLTVRYLVDAVELTLNGVTERRPCVAPGQLPAKLLLGGLPGEVYDCNFFTGAIRNFRIDHFVADPNP